VISIVGRAFRQTNSSQEDDMKYMLLIYTDPTAAVTPEEGETMHKEYFAFTQSIIDSKEMVSGEPLEGTDTSTVVRVRNGRTTTSDGPYTETKEVLGGYYVIDVKDLDRALELAAQIPAARNCGVEVRPVANFGMPTAP
jgi:hypothetical protein